MIDFAYFVVNTGYVGLTFGIYGFRTFKPFFKNTLFRHFFVSLYTMRIE